jgi:hypothetical protein
MKKEVKNSRGNTIGGMVSIESASASTVAYFGCAKNFIFGIPDCVKPIVAPFEFQRARYRFRNDDFAYVFLKTNDGLRKFAIRTEGDRWIVTFDTEQARNSKS